METKIDLMKLLTINENGIHDFSKIIEIIKNESGLKQYNVNETDEKGNTVFDYIVKEKQQEIFDLFCIKRCINSENFKKLFLRDDTYNSIWECIYKSDKKSYIQNICQNISFNREDIEIFNKNYINEENILMYSVESGIVELFDKILELARLSFEEEKFFDLLMQVDINNKSIISYAGEQSESIFFNELVKIFGFEKINKIYSINNDYTKNTLLMYACKHNNVNLVKYLIEQGANTKIRNKLGLTALNITTNKTIKKIILNTYSKEEKLELEKQINKDDIFNAIKSYNCNTVRLTKLGADLNAFRNFIFNEELINKTIFCNENNLNQTIEDALTELNEYNENEFRFVRVRKESHDYSLIISKNIIFNIGSSIEHEDHDYMVDKNVKYFRIKESMQTDSCSCHVFAIETIITLYNYLKENNLTLKMFLKLEVEKFIKTELLKISELTEYEEKIDEFVKQKSNDIFGNSSFIELNNTSLKNILEECYKNITGVKKEITIDTKFEKEFKNNILIPIPEIFTHLIQRSINTIQNMYGTELINKVEVIRNEIGLRQIKTQQQSIIDNTIIGANEKKVNNYINTVRETAVYTLMDLNNIYKLSRKEFNEKLNMYKENFSKFETCLKKSVYIGYTEKHKVIIEKIRDKCIMFVATADKKECTKIELPCLEKCDMIDNIDKAIRDFSSINKKITK